MDFPLKVGDLEVADAPALAALARAECGPGGPLRLPVRPHVWVPSLVAEGALAPRLAVALAAAFLQSAEAATVCEGARLAVRLAEPALGPLILRALRDQDTALLLQVDPGEHDPAGPGSPSGERSVEETLLRAAATALDLREPVVRRALLARLRDAHLPDVELAVLAGYGDAEELRSGLPAILAEELPPDLRALLEARARADDEGGAVARELLVPRCEPPVSG